MSVYDLFLLLLDAVFSVAATVALLFVPELWDCLAALMSTDSWPGER